MASDLEKFLQQAAERLAQKANAAGRTTSAGSGGPSGGSSNTPRPRPVPPRGNFAPTAEILEAEIVEGDAKRDRVLRQAGPDPLSTIDTRPALAQVISQADERMVSHVHQVFDHELPHLATLSPSLTANQTNQSEQATEVSTREKYKSPLLETLRNPETLRAAFIAGEIFNRRP